jgi:phytoene dehydrogenase-like protein
MMGWAKISLMLAGNDAFRDLMRATFWCPPHPYGTELDENNIPFMQVYKKYQPDMWTRELLEMTMFDLMDEYLDTEPFKVTQAYIALSSGAHGHMEGVAIPAMCSSATVMPPAVAKPVAARGNMHGYYHALYRCAVANGATFRTCSPVEEIIISNGRAQGVRLRDDATWAAKTIWARKAVISAAHIKPTFNDLIGPRHLDAGFLQRINDLSLKGGSLYMSHYLTKEEFRYRDKYRLPPPKDQFTGAFFNMGSREIYFKNVENVLGRQANLTLDPSEAMWGMVAASLYDETNPQSTRPDRHINGPLWMMVPTPQYNVDGMDAMDRADEKKVWDEFMRASLGCIIENLDDDNLVRIISDSPYEQEQRNTGMLGGSWYGIRCDRDQWWNERPLPELARYRVPGIDGLYLAEIRNQLRNATGFDWQSWEQAAQFCLQRKTNLPEALKWAEHAATPGFTGQENFRTLSTLSQAQAANGMADAAKATMQKAMAHPSATAVDLHMYARGLQAQKKTDEAVAVYLLNAKKHPGEWPVDVGLARAYSAQGKLKDALAAAKKALAQAPDDVNRKGLQAMIEKLSAGKPID